VIREPAAGPQIPADPLDWRPQLAREHRRTPDIRDPLVEPAWEGLHVLAHLSEASQGAQTTVGVTLIDVLGEEVTAEEPEVVRALAENLLAFDAVVDGFLTRQATRGGEGATLSLRADVSSLGTLISRRADVDVRRPESELPDESSVAFVAVDLLRIDGQELFEVPLLERKRLLESALRADELVRITPFARPPLQPWLVTWKAAGFGGVMVKAANSRYRPQTQTDEWTLVTRLGR
jgi:ATP-dependent DNA ligase